MGIIAAYAVPHPPLIIPAVGHGEEEGIVATVASYGEVARRVAAASPDTLVICSPHASIYADYFCLSGGPGTSGDMSRFGAPEERIEVAYDEEFTDLIVQSAENFGIPAGTKGDIVPYLDHASFIPLWFVRKYYRDFRVVRMGFSGLSGSAHYRIGQCIAQSAMSLGRRCIFIASGDLSHKLVEAGPYGFDENGPEFDTQLCDALSKGEFKRLFSFDEGMCEAAAECGLRSFQIMAGALDGLEVEPCLLSYEGPFGVGYGVFSFEGEEVRLAAEKGSEA